MSLPPPPPPPGPGYVWNGTAWVLPTGSPSPAPPPTVTAPAPGGTPAPRTYTGQAPAPTGGIGTTQVSPTAQPPPPPPPTGAGYSNGTTGVVGADQIVRAGFDANPDYYGESAHAADIAGARERRDALAKEYDAAAPRVAPQAAAPGTIPVAQTGAVTIGGPVAAVTSPVAKPATAVTPTVGAATQVAPIAQISADRIAAPTMAPAATIDRGEQNEFRTDQRGLVTQLQDVASGKTPTAADALLLQANNRALADQLSLAAGVHGYGGLAAHQTAARQIARLESENGLNNAILKAKEQEGARGQLGQAIGAGREQDIGLATKEGEFKQQTGIVGAQLATDVNKANAANALEAAKSNQNVDLQTGLTNAQAENRFRELQAQLNAQGGQFNASQENEMAKLRAQLETATSTFNAGQANDLTKLGAQLETQVNLSNTGAINTAALATADAKTKIDLANLSATLQSRELDDRQKTELMRSWLQANGQVIGWDTAASALSKGDDFTWRDGVNLINGLAQGGAAIATGGGSTASDKRLKKDIKPVSDDAVANLAEKLQTYEWTYKGEHDDGHRHVGVMAQDLEKDPLGKMFVRKGGDGMRAVDYQGLTAALLAHAIKGRKRAAT